MVQLVLFMMMLYGIQQGDYRVSFVVFLALLLSMSRAIFTVAVWSMLFFKALRR